MYILNTSCDLQNSASGARLLNYNFRLRSLEIVDHFIIVFLFYANEDLSHTIHTCWRHLACDLEILVDLDGGHGQVRMEGSRGLLVTDVSFVFVICV